MKQPLIAAILTLVLLACKKEQDPIEHKKNTYSIRIEAKGKDGSVFYSNEAYYANVNGGQKGTNEFASLTFIGYSGGFYFVDLTNIQPCGIDFSVQWLGKDTTIYVPGNTTQLVQLPGAARGNEIIKAKPLYRCGTSGGDMGWVEVVSPESLPIKFKSIRWEEVGKNQLRITFDVAEVSGINVLNVQLRLNTGEWKNVAVVFPEETQPNRQYSVTINL
jgi:hypothetical protein